MFDFGTGGELAQQAENRLTILHVAACQLADDQRMADHVALLEELGKPTIPATQMVDPHGGIGEDQDPALPSCCATAPHRLQLGLGSAEGGESFGAFLRNQCLEARPDERSFLGDAGQFPGAAKELVVNIECCSHMYHYA